MIGLAQISVTATAGNSGPSNYTNLRLAFAAVNDGTHQGAITIDITSSPSADNNTAVLNASGSGSASYTSVLVQPEGSTGSRSITGTVSGGPLVDLNGADNVTINGRIGDGYDLTISNQSTASSAGTSTIRFINDATDNTIVGCAILGRSTGTVAVFSGNILFGTGSSTGNDGNTISNCAIGNDGDATTNLISKAIVSVGNTGSLTLHNSGNKLEDCRLYNFFLPGGSRGVLLGAGNHAWEISGNKFYQEDARTTASAASVHCVVEVSTQDHADAGGHILIGNRIGFSNTAGTGVWEHAGSSSLFRAIMLNTSTTAPISRIEGNTIAGLSLSSTAAGTDGGGPATIIWIENAPAEVHDNSIGDQSGSGSIIFTPSAAGRHFHAVLHTGNSNWSSSKNRIGALLFNGNGGLFGLRSIGSGVWQCDSNEVGGTHSNSLEHNGTGSAGVEVHAIRVDHGTLHANGNQVRNVRSAATGAATLHGVHGVASDMLLEDNVIQLLAGIPDVNGIFAEGSTITATGNKIEGFEVGSGCGILSKNSRLVARNNTIQELHSTPTGTGNGQVHGIHAIGDSVLIEGNSIEALSVLLTGINAHVRGIMVEDAVASIIMNDITLLQAVNMEGIRSSSSTVQVQGNLISTLTGTALPGGNRSVHGVSVQGGNGSVVDNTIQELGNPSTGALSMTNGVYALSAVLDVRDNVIQFLTGKPDVNGICVDGSTVIAKGNRIEGSDAGNGCGILSKNSRLVAQNNAIKELHSTLTGTGNGQIHGIRAIGDSVWVESNRIEALSVLLTGINAFAQGIFVEDAVATITNNEVTQLQAVNVQGIRASNSTTVATSNSITRLLGTASNQNRSVLGINVSGGSATLLINTIQQLNNQTTGAQSRTRGLFVLDAELVAAGNHISSLQGRGPGADTFAGVVGIEVDNSISSAATTIRSNTVHTVHAPIGTGQTIGMRLVLGSSGQLVESNLVHSLWRGSTHTANTILGIQLAAGTSTVRNNMLRLGLDSAGASVNAPHVFEGIRVAAGTHAILHNTVYIGGEATTASSNHTYALYSEVTGTRDHRNNILWNARSNGAGSAKHYAVGVNASLTGLVSDHNCLYVSGTGGHVGREGNTDRSTLGAWQSATSLDGNSVSTNPGLVRPDGDATEVDLHIQHNSAGAAAISRAGATGTGVVLDFDGAQRHSPPDMGADQILLVLPDFFEEPDKPSFNYWRNKGQVVDTELNPRSDVKFYTDGGLPQTYLRGGSLISFTHASVDTSIATPDTTWRVDVRFTGEKALAVDPQPVDMRDPYRNYYLPWCGPNGATEVHGFGRVVYEDLYPYTDLHFYSGSGGPKLAFVIRPGGDMENIQLEFEGQDSLSVDGNGVLHAHVAGWDFPLIGGIAYQVDGGTIIPVGITTYLNSSGSPVVEIAMSFFSSPIDPELALIILVGRPPVPGGPGAWERGNLQWSTFVGNSGGGDEFQAIETDEEGNAYAAGYSWDSNFPIAPGTQVFEPFQPSFIGSSAALIMRFNKEDKRIQWGTFYGGGVPAGQTIYANNKAHKLAICNGSEEAGDFLFVTGSTNCTDLLIYADGELFSGAAQESYMGGLHRMWVGGIRKLNGTLNWSTTHGQLDGTTWMEDGLAIAVSDEGILAVGGKVSHPNFGAINFPTVTPAGAFTRDEGGAFFIVFDAEYAIKWSTSWAQQSPFTTLTDMRIESTVNDGLALWITGTTAGTQLYPNSAPLDVVPPPNNQGFYQANNSGGVSAYIAKVDISTDLDIELCTHWGSDGQDVAYGLELLNDQVWVVGGTNALSLDEVIGPDPGGGAYHRDQGAGAMEGFILCFNTDPWDLVYGTLYGGDEKDVILDVTSDGSGRIFMTGESRSADLFSLTYWANPSAYFQQNPWGEPGRRDAFLIGIDVSASIPLMYWRTAFGGASSDRGWGIAATEDELFLCGTTASQTPWNANDVDFPLVEFNVNSTLDFFQDIMYGGEGEDMFWLYSMLHFMDLDPSVPFEELETISDWDSFIASFNISASVGIQDTRTSPESVVPQLVDPNGLWLIPMPGSGKWDLELFDVGGRLVERLVAKQGNVSISLVNEARGVYTLTARNGSEPTFTVKLFRP